MKWDGFLMYSKRRCIFGFIFDSMKLFLLSNLFILSFSLDFGANFETPFLKREFETQIFLIHFMEKLKNL